MRAGTTRRAAVGTSVLASVVLVVATVLTATVSGAAAERVIVLTGFPAADAATAPGEDPCAAGRALLAALLARGVPATLVVHGERAAVCPGVVDEAADWGFDLALAIEGPTSADELLARLIRAEEKVAPVLIRAGRGRPAVLVLPDLDEAGFATRETLRAFVEARGLRPFRAGLDLTEVGVDRAYAGASAAGRETIASAWRSEALARAGGDLSADRPLVVALRAGPVARDHLGALLDDLAGAGANFIALHDALAHPARASIDPFAPDEPVADPPALPEDDLALLSALLTREGPTARAAVRGLLAAGEAAVPTLLEGALEETPFRGGLLEPEPGVRPPIGAVRLFLADAVLRGCAEPGGRVVLVETAEAELPADDAEAPGEDSGADDGADRGRLVGTSKDGRPVRVKLTTLEPMHPRDRDEEEQAPDPEEGGAPAEAVLSPAEPQALAGIPSREALARAREAYRAFWAERRLEPAEVRRLRPSPLEGTGLAWEEAATSCPDWGDLRPVR